jgi:hypothetical protein
MKKINLLKVITLFLISFLFTSCEAIESIFKAGMGFGIIIVIAVLVVLVFVISKLTKK